MAELVFLKLGGSLITDKNTPYTPRLAKLAELAQELKSTLEHTPGLRLILGHGSGSFGHSAAKKHGTRGGVKTKEQWLGFTEVRFQAAELNRFVMKALLDSGIPALAFPPSSTMVTMDGKALSANIRAMRRALSAGLLPVVYGDVVLDETRGGTILSTEDVFVHLAYEFYPQRILLAGLEAGVWEDFPAKTRLLNEINSNVHEKMRVKIGASVSADVTGGMESKVEAMLNLSKQIPGLTAQIFSGEAQGNLSRALAGETVGTIIRA
jgi:isopentenyl phosphate kinase